MIMLAHIPLSIYDIAASIALILICQYLWQRFFSLHGLPSSLPWAGSDKSALSRAKTTLRSLFGLREMIQHGYYKYSKMGEVFVLPNLATGPEVVLPMTEMKWLLEQPDHVLNQNEVNRQFLHADRTMLHPNIIRDMVHGRVIRREMTKDLDTYAEAIVEEIKHSLTLNWGDDPGVWNEVRIYDTMLDVISRISNRVLVGLPLCRNEEYLRSSSTFARNVIITAGLLNLMPPFLRPILSPAIIAYDMYHYRKIAKHIYPIVKERMAEFRPGVDYRRPDYSKHNDYIQWALHDAFSHDDPAERTPEMITKRLAVLSFAAIQSSVITITNAVFDIASSIGSYDIQDALREEVQEVTSERKGQEWKRTSLTSMIRIDSTLRESMRLWGFISRGVMKKVVALEGVTIPSGHHIPKGSKVGVTAYAIHHDNSVYKEAYTFNAFRFCKAPEEKGRYSTADTGEKAPNMVTSSDQFMAFSHGRHACPGRFFAANQLKLLLAQLVTRYDIEPVAARPPNPWINNTIGPPIFESLRVRRRPDGNNAASVTSAEKLSSSMANTRSKDAQGIPRMDSITVSSLLDTRVLQNLTGGVHELVAGVV